MIRITKGQPVNLLMKLQDAVRRPVDITAYDFVAVLKKATPAGNTILTFTLGARENSNGIFEITANSAATAALSEGTHSGLVRITRASDDALIGDNVFGVSVVRGIEL